uniref:Membrane-bound transcription factor site-2 protease n=1 Tax=Syphacia muris TaxID=451379 RepID=A0A0N5AIY2_9BILA
MLLTTAVSCFLAFWSLLFLTDFYLRAYSVRFYTNRFHQSILYQPLAVSSPYKYSLISKAVSAWFTLGATASLLCFIGITMYLTKVLWDVIINLLPASSYPSEQFVPQIFHLNQVDTSTVLDDLRRSDDMQVGLTPIVPGVNVPWSHLPLFLLVLAIVGIIHELGHALAAIDANVPVSGFGIFLIAFYPGAFTEIETEALGRSTSAQKMRIFGAGIWHNLVLAFFGYLLLLGVPHFLSHLFVINNGVLIRGILMFLHRVDSRSGLNGAGGLRKSDVVYAINGCSVRNSAEWYRCLRKIQSNQLGFCFPDKEIQPGITTKINSYDGEVHCCEEFPNVSLSHICFYFKNKTEEKIVPSINAVLFIVIVLLDAICFYYYVYDIILYVEHITCGKSTDCGRLSLTRKSTCVFPALFNGTTLMKIYISDAARPILFIGTTDECSLYFVLAIALLNAVPCYGLDGQFISKTIIESLFSRLRPE